MVGTLKEYIQYMDLRFPLSPRSKMNLKRYFNAVFARDLFDQTGFRMVLQEKDNMIMKVLELEENSND